MAQKHFAEQIVAALEQNTSDTAGITAATEAAEAAKTTADEAKTTADSALAAATTVASTTELGVVKVYGTTTETSNAGVYMNTSENRLCVPQASASKYGTVKTATTVSSSQTGAVVPLVSAVYTALSAKADTSAVPTNADYVDLTSEQTITGVKHFENLTITESGSHILLVPNASGAGLQFQFPSGNTALLSSVSSGTIMLTAGAQTVSGAKTFSGTTTFTGEVHVQDAVSSDSPVTLSQLQALIDRVAALEEAASASE